jgi:hypothetical protein
MTDVAQYSTVSRQARAIEGRSARGKVTGKLRAAIEAMVWEGSCRADAASSWD